MNQKELPQIGENESAPKTHKINPENWDGDIFIFSSLSL